MKIKCFINEDGSATLETRTMTPDGIKQPIRTHVQAPKGIITPASIRHLQSQRFAVAARGLAALSKSKED